MYQQHHVSPEVENNHHADYNTGSHDIKSRMKATWEDGDYATFATYMQDGAVEIINELQLPLNIELLDVGCGAGQTAIPAGKCGARVTGVDIAENLVAYAQQRAHKAGIAAKFEVGDAENLPCEASSFDYIISMFGAMFAPHPNKVVDEFARVTRPGGTLYMANWTASSMPAQMFKCVAQHMPPAPGIVAPVLWGDEETVLKRLDPYFTNIRLSRKMYPSWHYPFAAEELVTFFRSYFGPVKKAFDKAGAEGALELFEQLRDIYSRNSICKNDVLTITNGQYLEVLATRR